MSFTVQMNSYDAIVVNDAIADFQRELVDETQLESTLTGNTAELVQAATDFVSENKDTILEQHAEILSLNGSLRDIVVANKTKEQADADYDALVNSVEFLDLATKMAEIKATVSSLQSFLVEQGVRGRPLPHA